MWWRREAASGARGTRREEEAVQQRRREAAGAKAYADAAAKSEAATSFDMPASAKVHRRSISSILSSERLSYQRHDGLVNLGTVIILATNWRTLRMTTAGSASAASSVHTMNSETVRAKMPSASSLSRTTHSWMRSRLAERALPDGEEEGRRVTLLLLE